MCIQAVNLKGLLLFSWKGGFYLPHFQKRGNRIRASDKSLVFRFSAGSLLLLFLAVVLLLNLKTIAATDWKSVHFLQDGSVHLTVTPYMIVFPVIIMVAAIVEIGPLLAHVHFIEELPGQFIVMIG